MVLYAGLRSFGYHGDQTRRSRRSFVSFRVETSTFRRLPLVLCNVVAAPSLPVTWDCKHLLSLPQPAVRSTRWRHQQLWQAFLEPASPNSSQYSVTIQYTCTLAGKAGHTQRLRSFSVYGIPDTGLEQQSEALLTHAAVFIYYISTLHGQFTAVKIESVCTEIFHKTNHFIYHRWADKASPCSKLSLDCICWCWARSQ